MGRNVIYYGPPGTGKTFLIQKLSKNYVDFEISDEQIRDAYVSSSQEWVLMTLIILQNNSPMQSDEIARKIRELNLRGFDEEFPSTVLNQHSISIPAEFLAEPPQIFDESENRWFVLIEKLLQYDRGFFKRYRLEEFRQKRYEFVTFHQSFSYEDFVEGIRPNIKSDFITEDGESDETSRQSEGAIGYSVQDGIFKRICNQALLNPHKEYAIFIDEINRGNVSEIFGELITLIENDKRIGEVNELKVTLPYSKEEFGVPNNLNIIGTMNSADRSISMIDYALRRRFEFDNVNFDPEGLKKWYQDRQLDPHNIDGIDVIALMNVINDRIDLLLDSSFQIGQSYFYGVTSFDQIKSVIRNKIIPLLEEYFFDDPEKMQLVFSDLESTGELKENAIYMHKVLEISEYFCFTGEHNFGDKKRFFVNPDIKKSSVKKIYKQEELL